MFNLKEFVIGAFFVLASLGLVYVKGHSDGTDAQLLKQQAALEEARQEEARKIEDFTKALKDQSDNWQKYLAESKARSDRTVHDLRDNGVRLSVELADTKVRCITSDGRSLPDGRAELREDFSSALIGVGQRADAQVKALQEIIRTLQKP